MSTITVREAIKQGLSEALDRDPDVFIMGEDIGKYGGAYAITDGFLDKYGPKRIKDTPISEATFLGAGVGAAAVGLRPIVELMSISFVLVGIDQIVNMAANLRYMSGGQIKVPMVIRAPTGAGVQLGATHSQSFETWLAEVPGLKCVCPSNPYNALGLLRAAIRDNNPVFYAEPALLYGLKGEVQTEYYEIELGKANVERIGTDITLVSYGAGMPVINATADALAQKGVSAEVIDLQSLNPLDTDTILASVRKTNRLATLDTARKLGGSMSEVVARIHGLAWDWLDGPVVQVGARDTPWPYSRVLEQESLPDEKRLLAAIHEAYEI